MQGAQAGSLFRHTQTPHERDMVLLGREPLVDAQVYVHCIGDAIQASHPLMPSSAALSLAQHQGLFQ